MMNQNEEHEDMLFEEKKKKPEFREAGMDANEIGRASCRERV